MSPDAISPYQERPIRPLPKRRLRERLSPDVADSITYPPTPKSTTPLFYHPYNLRDDVGLNRLAEFQHPSERERQEEMERGYITRKCGDELDSDEDDAAYRSRIYSRHSESTTGRSYRYVQKPENKNPNPQAPASASSADSYDSFENTNNKKKRKIPTPGDSSLNGGHLSNDLAGMGISDDIPEEMGSSVGAYHSPGSASQGLSGPGRGRYGRIRNGRSPLRALSDSNWGNGRTPKQGETQGIISRSIANAHADKNNITPAHGQENISSLHQQASRKTSTQFTFTCDSQVPSYPGPTPSNVINHNSGPNHTKVNTQATQTSPNMAGNLSTPQAIAQAKQGLAASQAAKDSLAQPPPPVKKNRRRRTGKEYLIAARERRKDQEYKNYHHPPAAEDIWICEFCEYERIFGTPPEALIKQYEIKDRRLRKQEAERRRLLEKAKMKGRKGKKGNKGVKSAPLSQDRQQSHAQTAAAPPLNQKQNHSQASHDSRGSRSHDSQDIGSLPSDEYYPDGYNEDLDSQDEEYLQEDPPISSPSTAVERRGQVVHPDPGKHRISSTAIQVS
ncbi:hypothetical protein GLAREA_09113 [Glarea lozoyensis ATCC 20868]|uniref:Protein IBD2 n=1 Tax=Glarea lozoyensis (strain ATCC 20868 / MF5171) TaxID=1116229 RepID=S3DGW7_GLAL2|nr:uncharacterized protein GLAREA_09113 [Glarea lozoyensis ATCC 20868]EPE36950.1 hypothetical protein GLAREA_09113 [Glarea lozoyensis ATCC 20868]